jgi:hypothetical protein
MMLMVEMNRPMSRSAWRKPDSTRARVRAPRIARTMRSTIQCSEASRK